MSLLLKAWGGLFIWCGLSLYCLNGNEENRQKPSKGAGKNSPLKTSSHHSSLRLQDFKACLHSIEEQEKSLFAYPTLRLADLVQAYFLKGQLVQLHQEYRSFLTQEAIDEYHVIKKRVTSNIKSLENNLLDFFNKKFNKNSERYEYVAALLNPKNLDTQDSSSSSIDFSEYAINNLSRALSLYWLNNFLSRNNLLPYTHSSSKTFFEKYAIVGFNNPHEPFFNRLEKFLVSNGIVIQKKNEPGMFSSQTSKKTSQGKSSLLGIIVLTGCVFILKKAREIYNKKKDRERALKELKRLEINKNLGVISHDVYLKKREKILKKYFQKK